MKQVSNDILKRVYILFGLFLLFGLAILLRVSNLQVNHAKWVQREMDDKVFFKRMVADRGNILAEDGAIMATSIPFYKLAMDPSIVDTNNWLQFNDSLMALSIELAHYFDPEEKDTLRYYDRIRQAMQENDRHIYLTRKKVNFRELEMIKTWPILNRGRYEGGFVVEKFDNERFYPMGDLARITLGVLKDDTVGIRGIEASYNEELRGRDGYILAQKVVGNSYVPLDQFGEEAALDGYDIRTTLDVDMQDVVETALQRGVENNFAQNGVAILLEVESGKIKAIANYPETYNHAVATSIEPGSTFKIASATALLDDDLVQMCDTFDTGNGTLTFDDKEISDNGHAFGLIDFESIIAQSSNVGMALAVNQYYGENPDRYIWHLHRFGFGDIVNTQLKGEPKPKIIKPEDDEWSIAALPSLSYGYSLQVTPLQMATFYNGLANHGKQMRPWLIHEVRNNSRILHRYGPEVLNEKMCLPSTAVKLREMMKGVTKYGTASKAFRRMPFDVAGKTGTVRKIENGKYVKKYRASFGGYFPADQPRYTLYVMVDDPNGGAASGGKVAAPIFREIAQQIYKMDQELSQPPVDRSDRPNRKPAPGVMYAQSAETIYKTLDIETSGMPDAEWFTAESNGHQVNFGKQELNDRIPDMKGMSGRDAIHLMEQMGVRVRLQGIGRVRRQSLLPGYRIGEETSITLFLG